MDETIKKKSHILLLDDDESLRLSLKMFLLKDGYEEISDVATYDEALEIIDARDIDLIISDIILQGASGMDLLRHVKKRGLKIPVIMITGYPSNETIAESEQLGAFEYMKKPVKKDDFLRVTLEALQHYHGTD